MTEEHLARLVRAAARGDRAAGDEIFDCYRDPLRRVVGRKMGGGLRVRADSEDVIQTAFLTCFARLSDLEFRGSDEFFRWLVSVALNTMRSKARRHRADRRDMNREIPMENAGPLPREQTTASQAAVRSERKVRIAEAIEDLPEPDRTVVRHRTWDGLAFREVAARADLPDEDAARYVFRRALKRLADSLPAS